MQRRVIAVVVLSLAALLPSEPPMLARMLERVAGRIVAPVGRQVAVLDLDAPRPRPLTSLQAPSYAADLDASASGKVAVEVRDALGGDILLLSSSGALLPLVLRTDPGESLSVPFWRGEDSVFFERDDVSQTPIAYEHQANVRYLSRIESATADGSSRVVVVDDGRMPTVAADGSRLAYVRSSAVGTALLERYLPNGDERELLPASRFADVAYPRYSPDGSTLAFVAAAPYVGDPYPGLSFGVQIAYAHGLPWDVWLIDPNGGEPREAALLGADDPSLAWSPDGHQLFVYSGSGSAIVDLTSGETANYPYVAGYGAPAWIP